MYSKELTFLTLYLYTFSLYENASLIIFSAETEYISTRYWYRNINFLRDRIYFILELCKFGLVYGFGRHFQQYISYILAVSFIGVEFANTQCFIICLLSVILFISCP
jgi:hypothetical protein